MGRGGDGKGGVGDWETRLDGVLRGFMTGDDGERTIRRATHVHRFVAKVDELLPLWFEHAGAENELPALLRPCMSRIGGAVGGEPGTDGDDPHMLRPWFQAHAATSWMCAMLFRCTVAEHRIAYRDKILPETRPLLEENANTPAAVASVIRRGAVCIWGHRDVRFVASGSKRR